MKNLFKLFGIIAFIALIGFAVTACKEDPEEEAKEFVTIEYFSTSDIGGIKGFMPDTYSSSLSGKPITWSEASSSNGPWTVISGQTNGTLYFYSFTGPYAKMTLGGVDSNVLNKNDY